MTNTAMNKKAHLIFLCYNKIQYVHAYSNVFFFKSLLDEILKTFAPKAKLFSSDPSSDNIS